MALTDAAELQEAAVRATLDALKLGDQDEAAKLLAVKYAKLIDASAGEAKLNAWALRWIGPQLLDCLEALGATPRSRKAAKPDGKGSADSALARMRAARSA